MHKHLPHYTKSLISNARKLRRTMTDAERKLWNVLRNNHAGVKFRRQVPFGKYILDFYCHTLKLNIELDGSQHYTEQGMRKDRIRDKWLQENGIEVIRFPDEEVLKNIDGVGQAIYEKIKEVLENETPPGRESIPSPFRRGLACPPHVPQSGMLAAGGGEVSKRETPCSPPKRGTDYILV